MDTAGKGKRERNGESSIDIYAPCVKQRAVEKLSYSTGSPACCSVMTGGVGRGRAGRLRREGRYVCVYTYHYG